MRGYRRIKYFTREEAESLAVQRNREDDETNMVGSHYEAEEEKPGCWVLNHYVLRQLSRSESKNGIIPHDSEEGYAEGYIKNQ